MSRRKPKAPKPSRADARHEAAHAVVSVRFGLPLASTDIKQRVVTTSNTDTPMPSLREGYVAFSSGFTTLVEGTARAWEEALPDPKAVESMRRFAIQTAAGIVAEMQRGAEINDLTHGDDIYQIVGFASVLGIGDSNEVPAVREFLGEAVTYAEAVLRLDDGAAWDRVTSTLYRKKALTGDEVRSLVAASDSKTPELAAALDGLAEESAGA